MSTLTQLHHQDRRTRSEPQLGLSPCFLYFRYRGSNLTTFPDHGAGNNGHKLERATNKQKEKGKVGKTDAYKYNV
jgi:hypothetical protein